MKSTHIDSWSGPPVQYAAVFPLELALVSARPSVVAWVQQCLDQASPGLWRVTPLASHEALEAALEAHTRPGRHWVGVLVDTACPSLHDLPRAFWLHLARQTRLLALVDAGCASARQALGLLYLGFLAVLPADADAPTLLRAVAWHLQFPTRAARPVRTCLACQATAPSEGLFCLACGERMPLHQVTVPLLAAASAKMEVL